jgi:hypothetical protein
MRSASFVAAGRCCVVRAAPAERLQDSGHESFKELVSGYIVLELWLHSLATAVEGSADRIEAMSVHSEVQARLVLRTLRERLRARS